MLSKQLLNEWVNRWINSIFLCQTRRVPSDQLIYPTEEALGPQSLLASQGLLCSSFLTLATGILRLPATNFCLVHFLKSLNLSISWSTSCLCIWISVLVICNWMRKMPMALCCLAVLTKGCRALSWLSSCSPLSPTTSLTRRLWPSLSCIPTLPTVGSSTSLFFFLNAASASVSRGSPRPWRNLELRHSVEDLQGPRTSSGVSLRVLPGRWLSKHCVFQKQVVSRCSLCGQAPSWNF